MRRPLLTCLAAGLAASAFAMSLGGCAGTSLSVSGQDDPGREAPQQSIDQDTGIFDTSTLDLKFSDRDKDAAYDEATATKVMLSDEGIQIEGAGAVAEGGVVTLGQSGTYLVSGSLSQGQMVVDAADEDKLQVVMAVRPSITRTVPPCTSTMPTSASSRWLRGQITPCPMGRLIPWKERTTIAMLSSSAGMI